MKYIHPKNVLRVIMALTPNTQDYLLTIEEQWHGSARSIVSRGRRQSPGEVCCPLHPKEKSATSRRGRFDDKQIVSGLYIVMNTATEKTMVYWHRYWARKRHEWVESPYRIGRLSCEASVESRVEIFQFHPLRIWAPRSLTMPTSTWFNPAYFRTRKQTTTRFIFIRLGRRT